MDDGMGHKLKTEDGRGIGYLSLPWLLRQKDVGEVVRRSRRVC